MVKVVYTDHSDLKIVYFVYVKRCGLIRQRHTVIIILKDQWSLFIRQYDMSNVEIDGSKLDEVLGTSIKGKDVTFFRIGTKSQLS